MTNSDKATPRIDVDRERKGAIMKHMLLLWSMLVLVGLGSVWPLHAQDAPQADTAVEESSDELLPRAAFLKRKFEELLNNMSEVARLLEQTEPETAKILRSAVEHAKEQLLADKMEEVIKSLRKGLDEAAAGTQGEVISELSTMLKILEGVSMEKSELQKQIEARRKALEKLDHLIQREQGEERRTRPAANKEALQKQWSALVDALKDVIDKQQTLRDSTAKQTDVHPTVKALGELRETIRTLRREQETLQDKTDRAALAGVPVLGELQRKLATKTATLNKTLADVEKDPALEGVAKAADDPDLWKDLRKLGASAETEMNSAAEALGKSDKPRAAPAQAQARVDLLSAEKRLTDVMRALLDGKPSGTFSEEQKALSEKTDALSEKLGQTAETSGLSPQDIQDAQDGLGKAGEDMARAAEQIANQDAAEATSKQDDALEELRKQLAKAEELKRRVLDDAEKVLDAAEQNKIAEDTKALAEQMKTGEDGKPMAGKSAAGKAGQAAESAGSKMDSGDASGANQDQKQALEEMQRAREALEEEIADLERLSKQETLVRIEEQLQDILEHQRQATEKTRKTHAAAKPEPPRFDREALQSLAELADSEGTLAKDIQTVRRRLIEEGSTVVFPEVLGDVKADLEDVQQRLAEQDPGPLTQATQRQVERTLEELLQAVRDELSEHQRKKKGGGGGQGGGGKAPLIPPVAELRMLRLQQIRINDSTETLAEVVQDGKTPAKETDARFETLAERQRRITRLAREIAEKLNAAGGMGAGQ